MSHHLFLLSPSDTPLYSLTHHSTKPVTSLSSPLAANLPTWSTSAFAGTLTALSGASSAPQHTSGGSVRMGGGQDRHVIQMIANASLDVIEDLMRKENTMCVYCCTAWATSTTYDRNDDSTFTGISSQLTSSTNGQCLPLLRLEVRNTDFIALLCTCWIDSARYEICAVARSQEWWWNQVVLHGCLGVVCKGQFSFKRNVWKMMTDFFVDDDESFPYCTYPDQEPCIWHARAAECEKVFRIIRNGFTIKFLKREIIARYVYISQYQPEEDHRMRLLLCDIAKEIGHIIEQISDIISGYLQNTTRSYKRI